MPANAIGGFRYNGIDRVDSSRGYEAGNVVASCKRCNYTKQTMSRVEFVDWIRSVYEHLQLDQRDAASCFVREPWRTT